MKFTDGYWRKRDGVDRAAPGPAAGHRGGRRTSLTAYATAKPVQRPRRHPRRPAHHDHAAPRRCRTSSG